MEESRLDTNDKINKIQAVLNSDYVHDIRFFITHGRTSKSIDHLVEHVLTEELANCTVGYVTGRSGDRIDQLQFHCEMNTYPSSAYSNSVFESYYDNSEVQVPPLHRTPHCVYTVSECEEPVQVVTIDACPIVKTRVVTTTRKVVYTSPYQIFI
ncbi:unnamed protein product [Adineta ricciae]|uniref:Uncharacterized protein n=1 Tax=Adineta ricciae TaxID=249248 RepID=A0A816CIV9_ADIRI|nr:unnamed protein product [Adineta ricciae]